MREQGCRTVAQSKNRKEELRDQRCREYAKIMKKRQEEMMKQSC